MKVHKFGGASIKDAKSIGRIPLLLENNYEEDLIIVISAFGKTTNKMETIVNSSFIGNDYVSCFDELKVSHYELLSELMFEDTEALRRLNELFDECYKKILFTSKEDYDYYYDQIVSYGELFSSYIVYRYLQRQGFDICLKDARQLLISDNNWRAGNINEVETKHNIKRMIDTNSHNVIITQGFISGTIDRQTITLGREGSDYSAAIMAVFSNASELIFWKDVDGIYSADPNVFNDAVKIDTISYDEMIELSFFGAKVLHKKTLSMLMKKNIVTRVRSFLYPEKEGTTLNDNVNCVYPPIKIILLNQVLITAENNQHKMINGKDVKYIYDLALKGKFNINLIQISALKISFCVTYNKFSCERLFKDLNKSFKVKYNLDVTLETVRHYNKKDLLMLLGKPDILLTQVSRSVAQVVY